MSQIAYSCKDVVFHFNKRHLEDETIPMWVIKSHGVTFYVNHVEADLAWTTKETPDNTHTKGSLKFRNCKLIINDDNTATITQLGLLDLNLPHPRIIHRAIFRSGTRFHQALKDGEFSHSEFKYVSGGCGTSWVICDLLVDQESTLATIKYASDFRFLSPNEAYYKAYNQKGVWLDEDDDYDDDDQAK